MGGNNLLLEDELPDDQPHREAELVLKEAKEALESLCRSPGNDDATCSLVKALLDLHRIEEELRRPKLRVLLLGEFNTGKSTTINGLLQRRVLEVNAEPCTGGICEISYSEDEYSIVHHAENGGSDTFCSLEEGAKRVTKLESWNLIDESDVLTEEGPSDIDRSSHVELFVKSEFLRLGLTLVDSPGLSDSKDLTSRSLDFADEVDAVLFVFNVSKWLTVQEREYIKFLRELGHRNVFFVLNCMDQLHSPNEASRQLKRARDELATLTDLPDKVAIHCLSARNYLLQFTRSAEDSSRIAEVLRIQPNLAHSLTGGAEEFAKFRSSLLDFLVRNRAVARVSKHLKAMEVPIQQVMAYLSEQVQDAQTQLLKFEAEVENRQEELRKLELDAAADVNRIFARHFEEIGHAVQDRYSRIVHDLTSIVEKEIWQSIERMGDAGERAKKALEDRISIIERDMEGTVTQTLYSIQREAEVVLTRIEQELCGKRVQFVRLANNGGSGAAAAPRTSLPQQSWDWFRGVQKNIKEHALAVGAASALGLLIMPPLGVVVGLVGTAILTSDVVSLRKRFEVDLRESLEMERDKQVRHVDARRRSIEWSLICTNRVWHDCIVQYSYVVSM
mmetsp:Transcript_39537/g.64097  ORF Transcript_39537/g.64097 Transcript_39537/m.64097 type:complete len:617 (-) Transcript_39537:1292-3142(-)